MVASQYSSSLRSFVASPVLASFNVVLGLGMMTQPVTVPNTTVPKLSNTPFVLPMRRETVPVRRKGVIVSHKTSYSGLITVGKPAQEFRVVFDTGSGHVVFPSVECKSQTCLVHRRYNMSASQSAVPVNVDGTTVPEGDLSDRVTIGYGTGQIEGEFVRDEVCLGAVDDSQALVDSKRPQACQELQVVMAVEMSKQPFKNFGFDGILGLALGSLSLSKNFSFFDMFSDGGKAQSPHFSVFLTDGEDGDESEIAFGGYNPTKLLGYNPTNPTNAISWAPIINPDLGYWQLELLAVRVDGKTLDVCQDGTCRGVMDTGTSHLGIPSPHNELLGELLLQPAAGVSDCRYVKAPVLEFEFRGFNMTLYAEDYMRKLPLAEGVQVGSVKGVSLDEQPQAAASTAPSTATGEPNYQCRPRLMPVNLPAPLGPKLFILGEPVLHRYYTIFDWKGPQVGFALANKPRYANPSKMIEAGEVLRDDVKALISTPEVSDDVILVQLKVTFERRKRC